jgi:predicted transcriptional regulator of viral defense system
VTPDAPPSFPDWPSLLDLAVSQSGYFTTAQAANLGFSPELLIHHTHACRILRCRRGIYRVRHLPAQDDEDLVVHWLWSRRGGVFSHATALALHDLSDILPDVAELTLPLTWRARRLSVPAGLVLHHADVAATDRTWVGNVPVTSVARTLRDCAAAPLPPDILQQAIGQAVRRGLVAAGETPR